MGDQGNKAARYQQLRDQAENLIQEHSGGQAQTDPELLGLIHELKVAQIELEVQNEELKRAHQELSTLHQEYANLYEFAPCGYLTVDPFGIITKANLAAATLMRTNRSLLLKSSLSYFIASEWEDAYLTARKEALETGTKQGLELGLRADISGPEWIWADIEADRDQSGSLLQWRMVIMDITERKKAEQEREELHRKMIQTHKEEALGRMAGAVAHHFNNQLNVVQGFIELSLPEVRAQPELRANLREAMQASQRASEISQLMLTYLGQAVDSKQAIDLSETCRAHQSFFQAMLPGNVTLKTDLAVPGPEIESSKNYIRLILTHLISNAWEAVDENQGAIYLRTRKVNWSEIPSSNVSPVHWQAGQDEYACLEVSDNGCGISASDVDKLFDPFFTRKMTGRGMGLAVVQGIVSNCKGTISVHSSPGQGSTFQVFLPVCRPTSDSGHENHSSALTPRNGNKAHSILLVEDQDMVRKLGEKMLQHLGYNILSSVDGATALHMFEENQEDIQCVIVDYSLPDMDGVQLLSSLRSIDSGIPAIMTSGYDQSHIGYEQEAEHLHVFLQKPFKMDDLHKALKKVLQ